jgi:hypothetical protein
MVEAIADAIGDGISRLDLGIAEVPITQRPLFL